MAALTRATEASYEVHETIKVDTQDNEDHTFCGIMFPVKCKNDLPLDHIVIRSVAVRGQLGPLTVWVSNGTNRSPNNNNDTNNTNNNNNEPSSSTTSFRLSKNHWTKIYDLTHLPSLHKYQTLELDPPIVMRPGDVKAIYIHSTLPGDEAIVYDNAYYYLPHGGAHHSRKPRYDDAMISIFTGRAHVSNRPFGQMPIWGWGNAWRDHREFVGRLEYGARYKLWNPETETRLRFGPKFKSYSEMLFMCQRRWESPISMLPDECLFYILHMCRWDWFDDTTDGMKKYAYNRRKKIKAKQQQQAAAAAAAAANDDNDNSNSHDQFHDAAEEQFVDAVAVEEDYNSQDQDDEEEYDPENNPDDDDDDVDQDTIMDSDDDDDVLVEVIDDDDEEEEDDDEEDGMYFADHQVFRFVDVESDDEDDPDHNNQHNMESSRSRNAWMRRQFARIHILRALAHDEDPDVEEMHV